MPSFKRFFSLRILFYFFILRGFLYGQEIVRVVDEDTDGLLANKKIQVIYSSSGDSADFLTDSNGEIIVPDVGQMTFSIVDQEYFGDDAILTLRKGGGPYQIAFSRVSLEAIQEDRQSDLSTLPQSAQKIDNKSLTDTLQYGGFGDALQTVKRLPTVTYNPSYKSALLFIQGGSGSDWVARFNGVYIDNPLVWSRLVSMFNPSYVQSLTFYNSSYPTIFPNALSGAMDFESKRYRYNWGGYVGFNITSIEAFGGGPVNEEKTADVFLYLRRSLLETVIPKKDNVKTSEYPNTWDGGLVLNYAPIKGLSIQQLNWFVLSGLSRVKEDSSDVQKNYQSIPGYAANNRNFHNRDVHNKEYKGIHSIRFSYDYSPSVQFNAIGAFIPDYFLYNSSDNGIDKKKQFFLLLENQYTFNAKILLGNNVLTLGAVGSYFHYINRIDDYSTVVDGNHYEKVAEKSSISGENRGTVSPFLNMDFSFLDDRLRANFGWMLTYSSINRDLSFAANLRVSYKTIYFNQIYFGGGLYNRTDQRFYSRLKSQKVAESLLGTSFLFPWAKFSLEGFYRYYWSLPSQIRKNPFGSLEGGQDMDVSSYYSNLALKHAYGIGFNLALFEEKNSVASGDVNYTWQRAYRKELSSSMREDLGIPTDGSVNPPIGKYYRDPNIREHTLTFSLKLKPFIKVRVQPKYDSPSWYGAFHNYITFSLGVLSGATGPLAEKIKQEGTISTINYGAFDGAITDMAYRLDIQWGFPILGPDMELFLMVANVTNKKAVLSKRSVIENGRIIDNSPTDVYGGVAPFIGFKLNFPFRKENP